jgi:hypothetical protein
MTTSVPWMMMCASGARPLAAARSATLMPFAVAIDHRLSPCSMVRLTLAFAVALKASTPMVTAPSSDLAIKWSPLWSFRW